MHTLLEREDDNIPPTSAIFNFSCNITLAVIAAIIGVVKFKTMAWDKGNLWMLKYGNRNWIQVTEDKSCNYASKYEYKINSLAGSWPSGNRKNAWGNQGEPGNVMEKLGQIVDNRQFKKHTNFDTINGWFKENLTLTILHVATYLQLLAYVLMDHAK